MCLFFLTTVPLLLLTAFLTQSTDLGQVLEERVLNDHVEFTIREFYEITTKEFHEVIIKLVKTRKDILTSFKWPKWPIRGSS